jgi:hypothetical protein
MPLYKLEVQNITGMFIFDTSQLFDFDTKLKSHFVR